MERVILIVDDEQELRKLLTIQMKREGFKVYSTESGEKALDLLRSGVHIDAIVSDIRMPGGMDGVELMRSIKKENIRLPVSILMSGHAILHPEEIEELQVDHCLSKPFSVKKLSTVLRESLARNTGDGTFARKYPRTQKEVVVSDKGQEVEADKTFDLSLGGVFIQTQADLEPGNRFSVQIDLDPPLLVELEVKWVRKEASLNKPPGVGCEFVNLSEEDSKRLSEYLEEPKGDEPNYGFGSGDSGGTTH